MEKLRNNTSVSHSTAADVVRVVLESCNGYLYGLSMSRSMTHSRSCGPSLERVQFGRSTLFVRDLPTDPGL